MNRLLLLTRFLASISIFLFSEIFASAQTDTIKLDIGSHLKHAPSPWNNIDVNTNYANNCTTSLGETTGISITLTGDMTAYNTAGSTSPNDSLNLDPDAALDNLYGSSGTGTFIFAHLDPNLTYNFAIFGSRQSTSDRITKYVAEGTNADSTTLNTSNNDDYFARINNISPKSDSTILLVVSKDPSSGSNYYYINAILLTYSNTIIPDTEAPVAPENLTASNISTTGCTLNWDASTDNIGVHHYNIYHDGDSINNTNSTAFTVSGLTPASTHAYSIKAVDAAGNLSGLSNEVTITTLAASDTEAPTAPENLTASNIDGSSCYLSWNASTDNIGVNFYIIYQDGDSINNTTSLSCTVSDLTPLTTYKFTVKAVDLSGNVSSSSNEVTVTTLGDTESPSVPANLTAFKLTETGCSLSWEASVDNMGVVGYIIYQDGSSIDTISSTTLAVTGLTPSTTYIYTVKAVDATGNLSGSSNKKTVTTLYEGTTVQTDSIKIDIGHPSYKSPSPWNNIEWWHQSVDNCKNALGRNTGISVAVTDDFNSYNRNGTTSPDESLQLDTLASWDAFYIGAPDTLGALTFQNLDPNKVYSFTIFSSNTSSNNREAEFLIEGYNSGSDTLNPSYNENNIARVNNIIPVGDSIVFKVLPGPHNESSNKYAYLNAIIMTYGEASPEDIIAPSAPEMLTISDTDTTSCHLSWSASRDNVGVVGYTIYQNGDSIASTTSLEYSATYLAPATSFVYTVKAMDAAGNLSDLSNEETIITLGTPDTVAPSMPENLTATNIEDIYCNLNWDASTDNIEVFGYIIYQDGDSIDFAPSVNYAVSGLVASSTYTFTVKAMDASGNKSSLSSGVQVSTLEEIDREAPTAPENLIVSDITPTSCELSWGASTDNFGVDGYIIYLNGDSIDKVSETAYTVEGLEGNIAYTFGVKAIDAAGNLSSLSDTKKIRTTPKPINHRIVVIGSSTASGAGASVPDSAWVNRYEEYLSGYDTPFEVINLAIGGYTTYQLLPSDASIKNGINETIDTTRNITKALSYNPDAVIVNLPSNDAAKLYPAADQMENYRLIEAAAKAQDVSLWVSTTQPRNFTDEDQINIQLAMKDSTEKYFGNYAIDFWSGLADDFNHLLSDYDNGDGIHLNDSGHRILFERVIGKNIPEYILNGSNFYSDPLGEICNWDSDKKAAVVLTFDDWSPGHFPLVVPALKERNMIATFYIWLSSVASRPWPLIQETASYGNEIGNHSKTHRKLTEISAEDISDEVRGAKEEIDAHVTSQTVVSYVFPNGAFNSQVIDSVRAAGHIACRGISAPTDYTYNFTKTDNDYYNLKTYKVQTSTTISQYFNEIEKVIDGGGLLTYMYHSVDDETGTYGDNWYAPITDVTLGIQLDTLLSVEDKVWITTIGQAIKYHREARSAQITEVTPFNGQQWVINLTDTLSNNQVYNQPLTLKITSNGINFIQVRQNGKDLTIDDSNDGYILFKAVPDSGNIVLSNIITDDDDDNTGVKDNISKVSDLKVYPNPTQGNITIEFGFEMKSATLQLFDISGRCVLSSKKLNNSAKTTLDLQNLKQGMYLLIVNSENNKYVKKIILN